MRNMNAFCENLEVQFAHDMEIRFFRSEAGKKLANKAKPKELCFGASCLFAIGAVQSDDKVDEKFPAGESRLRRSAL